MNSAEVRRTLARFRILADQISGNASNLSKEIGDFSESIIDSEPVIFVPKTMLTEAVFLGNPGAYQYPGAHGLFCTARSVHDLEVCWTNGAWSCLISIGDMIGNIAGKTGKPVKIWSFNAAGHFEEETEIGEESAARFLNSGGKVYMHGTDPVGNRKGAIYIRYRNGAWVEQESKDLIDTVHIFSLTVLDGVVYLVVDYLDRRDPQLQVLKSTDDGFSWNQVDMKGVVPRRLVTVGNDVFVFDMDATLHRIDKNNMVARIAWDPFTNPAAKNNSPSREVAYGMGMLYTSHGGFAYAARKLFYLDSQSGALVIADFSATAEHVQDIVVHGEMASVLTIVRPEQWPPEPPFSARIYMSHTADQPGSFVKIAHLEGFKAIPYSIELMDGKVFLALGNRARAAYSASGDIYELKA